MNTAYGREIEKTAPARHEEEHVIEEHGRKSGAETEREEVDLESRTGFLSVQRGEEGTPGKRKEYVRQHEFKQIDDVPVVHGYVTSPSAHGVSRINPPLR